MDLVTSRAALRLAASLAVRPGTVLRHGARLAAELGQVGLGVSTIAPHQGDDRFADRRWLADPVRRRVMQTYLATTGAVTGLLDDVLAPPDGGAAPPFSADDEVRLRDVAASLAGLVCPGEPDGPPPRAAGPVPGRDVAATPGAVVVRTPMFELLQYLPRTERVHDVPVLLVPPLVHRYYLADLTPGHSLVEHLLDAGLQVFALSWRDPDPAHDPAAAGRDLDACTAAVLDAVQACTRISRCPRVIPAGLRTGGLLVAALLAHLAATGRSDRVAAAVYLGTVLDQRAALPGFRLDATVPAGEVLDGDAALRAWTWRRGGDRVRPYSAGAPADLPAGPLRRAAEHWASDLLHLPSVLHADLVALAASDPYRTVPETGCDGYLVTAADDPVQTWTAGHRTAQLLGDGVRLVLAPGDQIGSLLAVPGPDGPRVGPVTPEQDPQGWDATATSITGPWWADLAAWLAQRSGALRDAPPELGGRHMHPVHPAPTWGDPLPEPGSSGSGLSS